MTPCATGPPAETGQSLGAVARLGTPTTVLEAGDLALEGDSAKRRRDRDRPSDPATP